MVREAEWELNSSVGDLRKFLEAGSDDDVKAGFQVVKEDYFVLRLEKEYGKTNITEVVLRPSPPLSWAVSIENVLSSLLKDTYVRNALLSFFVSAGILLAFFLWIFLVSKVRSTCGFVGHFLAFFLALLILSAVIWGTSRALNSLNAGKNSEYPRNACLKFEGMHPTYSDFREMARNYTWERGDVASCEVLHFLNSKLTPEEARRLREVLGVKCE